MAPTPAPTAPPTTNPTGPANDPTTAPVCIPAATPPTPVTAPTPAPMAMSLPSFDVFPLLKMIRLNKSIMDLPHFYSLRPHDTVIGSAFVKCSKKPNHIFFSVSSSVLLELSPTTAPTPAPTNPPTRVPGGPAIDPTVAPAPPPINAPMAIFLPLFDVLPLLKTIKAKSYFDAKSPTTAPTPAPTNPPTTVPTGPATNVPMMAPVPPPDTAPMAVFSASFGVFGLWELIT
uniref:Uncharacterized protein n=1 Tax=Amphimedon queenslandica TaxID=400682 RepID=A0A1X7U050_AMPQE